MTLSILTERVYTSQGVPISVVGTAQVGIAFSLQLARSAPVIKLRYTPDLALWFSPLYLAM